LLPEFRDVVGHSWLQPIAADNKARALHIKLARLAKALKKWNKEKIADNKKTQEEAQQLLQLEQIQDERSLTEEDIQTRKATKNKILGIAAIKKIRLRQRSRLT
jgi:hypothetical protein